MGQIEKSVSFSAPVRRVFDYVADPAKQPEWFPGLKEVKNVEGAGSTMTYEWVYEASGLRFEGTARYLDFLRDRKITARTDGGVRTAWDWTFESVGAEARVHLLLSFQVDVPFVGKIVDGLIARRQEIEINRAVKNIREQVETDDEQGSG